MLYVAVDSVEGLFSHISKRFTGVGTLKFHKHASTVQIDDVSPKDVEIIEFPRPIVLTANETFSTWVTEDPRSSSDNTWEIRCDQQSMPCQILSKNSKDYKVKLREKGISLRLGVSWVEETRVHTPLPSLSYLWYNAKYLPVYILYSYTRVCMTKTAFVNL